jgi:hypothetical protein
MRVPKIKGAISIHIQNDGIALANCPNLHSVTLNLQDKAKGQGLWNLWMAPYLDPKSEHSPGLKVGSICAYCCI